jgi:hypothetical protein
MTFSAGLFLMLLSTEITLRRDRRYFTFHYLKIYEWVDDCSIQCNLNGHTGWITTVNERKCYFEMDTSILFSLATKLAGSSSCPPSANNA